MSSEARNPELPETRRFPIRLPSPIWIFATTVIVIAAGIASHVRHTIRQHEREHAAIREIGRLGGWVETNPDGSVKEVDFSQGQIGDFDLVNLEVLASLQMLDLRNTQVTDAGLAHLRRLTGLRGLFVSQPHVTGAGVAELRQALPRLTIIKAPPTPAPPR